MTYQEFIDGIISERGHHYSYHKKIDGMEIHHIKMRALGGTDNSDNLVALTYAEHLKAHVLLFRENPHDCKIAKALKVLSFTISVYSLVEIVDNDEEFNKCVVDIIEARNLAREAQCGEKNYMYGKTYGSNPNAKSRVCIDTGEIFTSAKEAGEHCGIAACCVIDACNGKQKEAGGFKWMNYSEWELLTSEEQYSIQQDRIEELKQMELAKQKPPKQEYWTAERRLEWGKRFSGENSPMYGKHLSDETKAKISKTLTGKIAGENNPMYGKHHSEETKKKIAEKHKGIHKGGKSPRAKAVVCIETKVIYPSISEAAEANNVKHNNISSCLSGRQKTAGGYHWMYYEEYLTLNNR